VATRRRKKRSWLKTVLFYILFPLAVWFVAFLLWFYWRDVSTLFGKDRRQPKPPPAKANPSEVAPTKRPQEKILDQDRKELEEILKRRS
jgi:hypothetical protein